MNLPDLTTEFPDRVAIVTGGGSGIGHAIDVRWATGGPTLEKAVYEGSQVATK